ncbi:MAG: tetratricopeptide repeat protein [Bacteroidetes bacterium]|nr:tetratricopeptide repeat protein [Bacteroidota bacterium]
MNHNYAMRTGLLLLSLFIYLNLSAQNYTTQHKIETVIAQRSIYLNGGARASMGGKSRVTIPIQLPRNTVRWYYSFSTSPGESGTDNLNLLVQLSSIVVAPAGITRNALSNIQIPSGSASIDVYLMDQVNADAFLRKVDNDGGTFYYNRDGSVFNTRQAVVSVNSNIGNQLYLGLKNPSMMDGINITIEVVAEAAEEVYQDEWVSETTDKVFEDCVNNFSIHDAAHEQVCNCFKDKIVASYTPSSFSNLSNSDLSKLYNDLVKSCAEQSGNSGILQKDKRIKELVEFIKGQTITKDYSGQEKSLVELITLGVDDYQIYNSLAYCQLCLKKYDEAKKNLTIGLGKNPTDLFLLGNLGDYYLLTNQYDQAIEIFRLHKNERLEDKRHFKDAVADDLKEFERLGITNDSFNKVRKELRIE